jgi:hypothetical protein
MIKRGKDIKEELIKSNKGRDKGGKDHIAPGDSVG